MATPWSRDVLDSVCHLNGAGVRTVGKRPLQDSSSGENKAKATRVAQSVSQLLSWTFATCKCKPNSQRATTPGHFGTWLKVFRIDYPQRDGRMSASTIRYPVNKKVIRELAAKALIYLKHTILKHSLKH